MFKYAKITLLTLVAFLLLGFTITANASPPWLGDKDQMIMSSPLLGYFSSCTVVWLNDDPGAISVVDVHFQGKENSNSFNNYPMPYNDPIAFIGGNLVTGYCTVKWFGQPSDVRATFCQWDTANDINGCVELR